MLVLVVGASGAGKDMLIDAARAALADDRRFVFPRRVVTRGVIPGGEEHDSLSVEDFQQRQAEGGFAFAWHAHGLQFGIPATIDAFLRGGRVPVVNISRALVAAAAERYRVRVLEVTAPDAQRARRLAERGRRDMEDMTRRLLRGITLKLPIEREVVVNDGSMQVGMERMVAALIRAAEAAPPA